MHKEDLSSNIYLSRSEAAAYLRVSRSFLNNLAWQGRGPIFYKVGARCVYKRADLDSWVEMGRQHPDIAA